MSENIFVNGIPAVGRLSTIPSSHFGFLMLSLCPGFVPCLVNQQAISPQVMNDYRTSQTM